MFVDAFVMYFVTAKLLRTHCSFDSLIAILVLLQIVILIAFQVISCLLYEHTTIEATKQRYTSCLH